MNIITESLKATNYLFIHKASKDEHLSLKNIEVGKILYKEQKIPIVHDIILVWTMGIKL